MTPPALSYWPADTSRPVLDLTLGDVLRQATSAAPHRPALIEVAPPGSALSGADRTDRTWTYAQLLDDVEHAASWLAEHFAPGEHLAVWAPNLPEWVILQYGAALAGLVLVTVNPALRDAELQHVLSQSGAVGLLLTDSFRDTNMAAAVERIRPRLPRLREQASFTGWLAEIRRTPIRPLPPVDPGSAAQIQYTSGTTGTPKGAVLHHRGLVTNAAFTAARAGFPHQGTWVSALPLFHTAGCDLTVLGIAVNSGTLVLVQVFQPDLVLDALQQHRADFLGGVPVMLSALLNHPSFGSYDLSACSAVLSGGDRVPPELIKETERRFGARFSLLYGQTELSPTLTQTAADDDPADRLHTVGRPLWQAEVKIADPAGGDPLPVGEPGEICGRGYQAMLGYHDLPEATAQTLDSDGWLHTGDLGVMDERGYVTVTGRIKDMIIRGGENIYPAEIEAVLLTHPGVRQAAVLGVPDPQWGEQVAAVIIPADPGAPPTAAELHDHLRATLAPHKTPRNWYLADDIPANAMGKTQKYLLRRRIGEGDLKPLP
ncbi:class I adenylate-forming enzyme family protein [Streptomyces ipomoeae]|uniref:class I adenylate-forming enzyme family protein n=1 Tax=Streptomyces ipomoeae TaxID=103232 RepID=UPI0011465195|nr:AMP-binding protein [Streptomyces ipomoeae]MDX2937945.1 AMP-binding protein [Streptomyces ipomoeae]TQE18318.1 long-chain fatty acid--CoA ligase [Streptomyces ipomoeae]